MSATHTFTTLKHRISDVRALLQHRARTAQAACEEALVPWSGPRGRGFAAQHIDPQLRLLACASEALLALSRALEAAGRHAQAAEEHLAQARQEAGDVQPAQAEAARLTARARQILALARERAYSAQDSGRRLSRALDELGAPPA